jgi:hypothetical protein
MRRLYADVDDAPPRADQRRPAPPAAAPAPAAAAAARALRYYATAASLLSEEYAYPLQMGRCLRRLGRPPREWLPLMALACRHAALHHRGLLDPVCALHAARLELLREVSSPPGGGAGRGAVLRLLGRYCFAREAQARLGRLLPPEPPEAEGEAEAAEEGAEGWGQEAEAVLFEDGVQAMTWVLEQDKFFYKASVA